MDNDNKYYLGIDWGKSLVGLALADSELFLANAFKEVETKDLKKVVAGLAKEYDFEKIIIGETSCANQYYTNQADIDQLVDWLKSQGLGVERENENFSTQLAQQNLAEQGKKGISKHDNAESARLILQSWLDKNKRQ